MANTMSLQELSDKVGEISEALNDKMDKGSTGGKGLSTNDFTDTYKDRLDTLTDDYIKDLIEDGSEISY